MSKNSISNFSMLLSYSLISDISSTTSFIGNVTVTSVPSSNLLEISMIPPCISTRDLVKQSPIPLPNSFEIPLFSICLNLLNMS